MKLQGDINEAISAYFLTTSTALPALSPQQYPGGILSFSGKVQGNLRKLKETLKADGSVSIRNFSYQKWGAELVEAEAKWVSSSSGGEISLVKASATSPEQSRKSPNQPGGGGKIEIGSVRWAVGSTQPVKIPLHFEGAHLHWLAAPVFKKVYGLEFRLNGNISATLVPATNGKWQIAADMNSSLDQFQLDNQRYQKDKPLKTVFKIPEDHSQGASSHQFLGDFSE